MTFSNTTNRPTTALFFAAKAGIAPLRLVTANLNKLEFLKRYAILLT
jgi:hypothetical protein